jgi:hypothetical protein
MIDLDKLQEAALLGSWGGQGSHWDDCYYTHRDCAMVTLVNEVKRLQKEMEHLDQIFAFHPFATKLMGKRKNFVVVACDEPYFQQVYDLIREHEIKIGRWTKEDQYCYEEILGKEHEQAK